MLLDGMRVISLCHFLQGPACTQYLADLGATVIKIEPPHGPFERKWAGANAFPGGVSNLFLAANRNKKSLAIDLKTETGREIFLRLVESADVVMENFRDGVLERLGLGFDVLRKRNPAIIYASSSGWAGVGPMAGRPAQDLIIQARVGLVAANGPTPRAGRAVGGAAIDQHSGCLMAMGIVAAYVKRLKTGKGTRVEGSLFAAGADLMMEGLTMYLSGGFDEQRALTRDEHLSTWFNEGPYGVYPVKDATVVIPTNDPAKLAKALRSTELEAFIGVDTYAQRDAYAVATAAVVKDWTYCDLSAAFDALGIWYGKVQHYRDLKTDPQAIAQQLFTDVDVNGAKATIVNHPLVYDGRKPEFKGFPLQIGQHTREVLRELNYSDAQVDELARAGVVKLPQKEACT